MAEITYQYSESGQANAVSINGEVHELSADDGALVPPTQFGTVRDLQVSIRSTLEQIQDSDVSDDGGSIIVGVEATHGGYTNKNGYHYLANGMRKYVDTWTTPFGKPYLINHDGESDPKGRVVQAKFVKT